MRINRNDVAREAGVSPTTVSFVLNNKEVNLTPETKRKVKAAAKKLGYVPNRIAQALKTGKSNIITLWVYNFKCLYTQYVINSIRNELNKNNYEIIVKEIGAERKFTEEIYCDGIISFDCEEYFNKYINETNYDIPIVNGGVNCNKEYDNVNINLTPGVLEAYKTLEKYKKVGLVICADVIKDARYIVYKDFIKENNLKEYILNISDQFNAQLLENEFENCDFFNDIEAIFCFNDNIALRLIGYLHKKGINVPKDVKIIGNDNLGIDEYFVPNLSSVSIPVKEVCEKLVEFIINRINEPNKTIQTKTFDSKFIERESSV